MVTVFRDRLLRRWPALLGVLLFIWVGLAAVTAASLLARVDRPPLPPIREEYDPLLVGIDSVDEFMFGLEQTMPSATPLQKLDAADAILRRRFVHGYSHFRFDQDWLAASLRFVWDDLAQPVRPDDILQFRRAACSQQSLVFLEIARRLGFERAAVNAPGHFLAGVKIDGEWWIYDANREIKVRRYPLAWAVAGDPRVFPLYKAPYGQQMVDGGRKGQIFLRDINGNPAPQATLLHQLTWPVSHFGWLVAMLLWLWFRRSELGRQIVAGVETTPQTSRKSATSPTDIQPATGQ